MVPRVLIQMILLASGTAPRKKSLAVLAVNALRTLHSLVVLNARSLEASYAADVSEVEE